MPSSASAALTGSALAAVLVAVLVSGCADPAADRVSLVGATQPPASPPQPSPSAAVRLPQPAQTTISGPVRHPFPPATSLADPLATGAPLAATGRPRFFVSARAPLTHFPGRTKTAVFTPVPPAVHDAETGAFVANIPLPPGIASSWHLVAAARDNRTFAIAGWTEPKDPTSASSWCVSGRTGGPSSRWSSRRPTPTS